MLEHLAQRERGRNITKGRQIPFRGRGENPLGPLVLGRQSDETPKRFLHAAAAVHRHGGR